MFWTTTVTLNLELNTAIQSSQDTPVYDDTPSNKVAY